MIDQPVPTADQAIIVTASRAPQEGDRTAASVAVIEGTRTERLGEPLLGAVIRLTPSASLSVAGPAGSQTQLRIRGAEANHTLLFVDGIRANDPAAGNEPRFELLNTDLGSRIEVVRGPQSALWGSEAIGGVVAVGGVPSPGFAATAEAGSRGFGRLAGSASSSGERLDAAVGAGFQRSEGINSFAGGPGDRDGYRNAVVRGRVAFRPNAAVEVGGSAFAIAARSEFDGYDPLTFLRADTGDESRNRLAAARLWTSIDTGGPAVSGHLSALRSTNRNLLDGEAVNRTRGQRTTAGGQLEQLLELGSTTHQLIGAIDWDRETFRARDQAYGGASNQDRSRNHHALTGEWRATFGPLTTDLALRHDRFNRFKDATTVRASALVDAGRGIRLAASYGEGIAQPTFFDLYGFYPGSFIGNPSLAPEQSRGLEASLRFRRAAGGAAITVYRQRLRSEIIDVFDATTFQSTTANAEGRSTRKGVEVEADWSFSPAVRLSANYAYLDASERTDPEARAVRELRRPRHSGSVLLDGEYGRLSYGASLSYAGARRDRDFDQFPAALVRLDPAWLAGARIAYRVSRALELFGRVANAFDSNSQDVVGYRTEGRSAYAGVRLALGS